MKRGSRLRAALGRVAVLLGRSRKRKLRLSRSSWDSATAVIPDWIYAPFDHPLAAYLRAYPLYDRMLPLFAALMSQERPQHCLIDVGANIGDTAALVRIGGGNQRIICVEASDSFFGVMKENVELYRNFYGDIELVRAFVGRPGSELALKETRGTAKLVQGESVSNVPIIGLAEVAHGRSVGIVKLDTDGFDWEIILQSIEWLRAEQPSLWVEAEINSQRGFEGWAQVVAELSATYAYVFAFDNFGFPIASFPLVDATNDVLLELILYASRSVRHRRTVSYMDLCFVSRRDDDLVGRFQGRIKDVLVRSGYV